ncbi:MAG: hypothetical protein ACTTIO_02575 [Candidatus Fimenecus sp.]
MSAFLGPIHFWLYRKIGKQEELTKAIASYAEQKGWIEDQTKYTKDLPALEDVIDESNIHGWLQGQIHDAETRYADLIGDVWNTARLEGICGVAFAFGKKYTLQASTSPAEAYKAFEDFFVNGMPCDRVNAVVSESENELSWTMTQDIHAQYWKDGSEIYYTLRSEVMRSMLNGTGLVLASNDNVTYTIKRQ